MGRIDEIKEKVRSWESEPCLTTEEAEYLLSRLEIAEKALEDALESMIGLDRNVYSERGGDIYEYYEGSYIEKIREALQQIRS